MFGSLLPNVGPDMVDSQRPDGPTLTVNLETRQPNRPTLQGRLIIHPFFAELLKKNEKSPAFSA